VGGGCAPGSTLAGIVRSLRVRVFFFFFGYWNGELAYLHKRPGMDDTSPLESEDSDYVDEHEEETEEDDNDDNDNDDDDCILTSKADYMPYL